MGRAKARERQRQTVGTRQRGVGFPRVSLPMVVDWLSQAARSYGPVFSREAFAALGARRRDARASTRSGSYLTKLAAFKDFGLVDVDGSQVRLTELAQRIALSASAAARQEALQTAFQQASVFGRLYEDTPKGEPIAIATIADRAIWHCGVAAGARDTFARAFVESAAAAGLLDRLDQERVRLLPPAEGTAPAGTAALSVSPSLSPRAPLAGDVFEPAERSQPTIGRSAAMVAEVPPVVQQRWSGPSYVIGFEIRADRPLRPALFRQIADIVAEIERLAAELGS